MTTIIASMGVAFVLSLALTGWMRSYALKRSLIDVPNHRSSHAVPTPRGGGVAFCIAVSGVATVLGVADATLLGAMLVGIVGFADDHLNLRSSIRFFLQVCAASLVMYFLNGWPSLVVGGLTVPWGQVGILVGVVGMVWSVNLFNFMDGLDTIASMEAIVVLSFGGCFLLLAGGEGPALLAFGLVAAVAGFLFWNIPPAKIFMGDGGSYFAGFMIGGLAVVGEVRHGVPALLWVILYGVFWFDATATFLRRLARGERWYGAHRLHAYQRLHRSGWSHGQVSLAALGLNIGLGLLAVWGFFDRAHLPHALLLSLVVLGTAYVAVEYRKPMWEADKPN